MRTKLMFQGANNNLGEALQFLREYDNEASSMCTRVTEAQWLYATNITEQNRKRMVDALSLQAKLDRVSWQKVIQFSWSSLPDPMARRQLQMLALKGRAALPQEKQNEVRK
ncbi:unnamed protein product [Nesidiocoris tenuis]|uniref:Uncharacterized protein n=1 Tax=Nesidiocoris tenuis TaxID=355587 RepID=A0A6H5GCY1_9HEMI|nr:unnamed protein product [Nesidiocoris tenuis]